MRKVNKSLCMLFMLLLISFEVFAGQCNLTQFRSLIEYRNTEDFGPGKISAGAYPIPDMIACVESNFHLFEEYMYGDPSDVGIYMLGLAVQYVSVEHFVAAQGIFVDLWKKKKISNQQLNVGVFLPTRATGRLYVLHKRKKVALLMEVIRNNASDRELNMGRDNKKFFDDFESGRLRRIIRAREKKFGNFNLYESEDEYSLFDRSYERLLDGYLPLG